MFGKTLTIEPLDVDVVIFDWSGTISDDEKPVYKAGMRVLEKFGKKIIPLGRKEIESNKLIKESKGRNIALLVYGSPLFATTHISLILDAEKQKVRTKIIYSTSVFDALAETGLQLYKFGKIISMPSFHGDYEPDFSEYLEENISIRAHSLILADMGLSFKKALIQLEMALNKKQI